MSTFDVIFTICGFLFILFVWFGFPLIGSYLEYRRDGCWHEEEVRNGVYIYCKKCNKRLGFIPFA